MEMAAEITSHSPKVVVFMVRLVTSFGRYTMTNTQKNNQSNNICKTRSLIKGLLINHRKRTLMIVIIRDDVIFCNI